MKEKNIYDDGNIPEVDLPSKSASVPYKIKTTLDGQEAANVIPDEVPRRDGPGGEGM